MFLSHQVIEQQMESEGSVSTTVPQHISLRAAAIHMNSLFLLAQWRFCSF